jgi:large subunit ribosomal protein L18e
MQIDVERQDLKDWLSQLSSASREDHYKGLWKRVLKLSEVPARSRKTVNLYKINRYSKEGDSIIVPGKVLGEGQMAHKISITAMEYSARALSSLRGSQCRVRKLDEILKEKRLKIII